MGPIIWATIFRLLGYYPPLPLPQGSAWETRPNANHYFSVVDPAGLDLDTYVGPNKPIRLERWPCIRNLRAELWWLGALLEWSSSFGSWVVKFVAQGIYLCSVVLNGWGYVCMTKQKFCGRHIIGWADCRYREGWMTHCSLFLQWFFSF